VSTAVEDAAAAQPTAPARPWFQRLNFVGLFMAVTTFGWALTPSLLPRPWIFEGIIAGLGAALGYGLGCFLSWLVRLTPLREPGPKVKQWAWRVLAVWAVALVVTNLLLGTYWQNGVREAVGFEDEGYGYAVVIGVVAAITAVLAVLFGRALRRLNHWIGTKLDIWLPARVAFVLAALLVGLLIYLTVTDVIFRVFSAGANAVYSGSLSSTADGVTQPQQPEVSGSPDSLIAWDTLGFEGRNFVSRGPSAEELTAFNGEQALTPIRVYAGLESADSAEARADLAVQDLERAGAFDRAALFVCGTTGTGWIEPQTANALEYEWNGDSAIVGIQYSFLPSWISTLVDVDDARTAGQAIWSAVYEKVQSLPEGSRPKLFACGLSLGSFSLQSAFPDAATIAAQSDGAVFVGTPNFSQPWGAVSAAREPGSPQWQPVYKGGETVRFAGVAADMAKPAGAWGDPKVLYVQHANDSVVWWSAALLAQQPDWLMEPPGPGRSPDMRWYPVITWLQVTVDQFMGVAVPQGQGHNYGDSMAAFWAEVAQPPGWTAEDSDRLTALIPTLDNY